MTGLGRFLRNAEKAAAGSGERRLWLECAADKGERHGGI
jgi:hypothetical protein